MGPADRMSSSGHHPADEAIDDRAPMSDHSSRDGDFLAQAQRSDPSLQVSSRIPLPLPNTTCFFPRLPTDLLFLALWVFGPHGPPDIRILAYGDFSFHGRYAKNNMLLCKNLPTTLQADGSVSHSAVPALPFRLLTKDDRDLQEFVHGNMGMLGACAVESIFSDEIR